MENWKFAFLNLLIPFMIFSYSDFVRATPLHLQGTVIDAQTGRPVEKAHLYIVKGSEEILSNQKGEFKLATWQKLPLTLTVEHSDYKTERVTINDQTEKLTIRIRKP